MSISINKKLKVKYFENEILIVIDDNIILAKIIRSPFSYEVYNENIQKIRSIEIVSEAYTIISQELQSSVRNYHEDQIINSIECVLDAFDLNIESDKLFGKKEFFLKVFNALEFSYNNLWYECRLKLKSKLHYLFDNISDSEGDVLLSFILLYGEQEFFNNIEDFPFAKLKYQKEYNLNMLNEFFKNHINDFIDDKKDEFYKFKFSSVDEVISYLNKYK